MSIVGHTPRTGLPIYAHFSESPWDAERWPNFSPAELACRGTGKLAYHPDTLDLLQALRVELGRPMMINSAYRSPEHNASLRGAARTSWHMDALAFDVSMANHDPHLYEELGRRIGFTGVGTYPASNFIHLDTRGMFGHRAAEWGDAFPIGAAPFQSPEPAPRPAVSGREAGAGAVAGGGAVLVAPTVIREVSPTIEAVQGLDPMAQSALIGGTFLLAGGAIVFGPRLLRAWREYRRGEADL